MKPRSMFTSAGLAIGAQLLAVQGVTAQPTGVAGYDVVLIEPLEGQRGTSVTAIDDSARIAADSVTNPPPNYAYVWINGRNFEPEASKGYSEPELRGILKLRRDDFDLVASAHLRSPRAMALRSYR